MSLVFARALATGPFASNGLTRVRPVVLLTAGLLLSAVGHAAPLKHLPVSVLEDEDLPKDPGDASLWIYLSVAVALVLLGGIFAGLTIALMGQDEIYLQVLAASGDGSEKKNAARVLRLLKKGKHWVLVTLLLSNVITNETLPIVLDRSLGGGWPAVVSSTVLIVIFGEVVPQSICVRYGLPIGAWMSPVVLALMWIMCPVAWPTAKLLDYLLGEDHGTTYKKAGLKTLVTLHKTLGSSPEERLNQDEVTIISAVLDLKEKPVGSIMTPMNDVFTMSADTVLDEKMMDTILSAGYSRIPIYEPNNPRNFVGMLLVKLLITYDPEDCKQVRDFALATLPETRPETSCLDIVNFFQEGKSHMVLVSDFPGESFGALGVVTLEDVIEELIGEEIIDESDVFIDVHKAIRRITPAPRNRVPKGEIITERPEEAEADEHTALLSESEPRRKSTDSSRVFGTSPQVKLLMRRSSSGNGSFGRATPIGIRDGDPELREHLKHLGPSNAASNPRSTRISTVKIKPSVSTIPEGPLENGNKNNSDNANADGNDASNNLSAPAETTQKVGPTALQGGIGEGILANSGRDASDGAHAVATSYGSIGKVASPVTSDRPRPLSHKSSNGGASNSPQTQRKIIVDNRSTDARRSNSSSTIGSMHSGSPARSPRIGKATVRSGSISENVIDVNGVKKMILDVSSSSDSEENQPRQGSSHSRHSQDSSHRNWGSSSGHSGYVNVEPSSSTQPGPQSTATHADIPKDEDVASGTGDSQGIGEAGKQKKKRKKRAGKKKKGTW
ncbi:Cystathionine beta-synthase core [Macrophomina phaseolina MS6]|uniref:Cystathionine beta-synthase core n=1 Tax=Macrophomina phaseolina (strain MS6) TaxID=1126212 RepID=K2RDZ1_MACPH|nr:Cystathionine beta-synthase core [Macrophomina phaseolina MS6]